MQSARLQVAKADNRGMLKGIDNMGRLDTASAVPYHKLDIEDKEADLVGQQMMVRWTRQRLCLQKEVLQEWQERWKQRRKNLPWVVVDQKSMRSSSGEQDKQVAED